MVIVKLYRTQRELMAWSTSIPLRTKEDLHMHNAHACYLQENGRPDVWPSNGGSTRSLQWSSFRGNATIFDLRCQLSTWQHFQVPEVRCDLTDRQTDRHTHSGNYHNPHCTCSLRVNIEFSHTCRHIQQMYALNIYRIFMVYRGPSIEKC